LVHAIEYTVLAALWEWVTLLETDTRSIVEVSRNTPQNLLEEVHMGMGYPTRDSPKSLDEVAMEMGYIVGDGYA
jgi:hypothetical protein